MTPEGRARMLVIAAAILFSTGGAVIKSGEFSGLQVSCARSGIAALTLLAFARGRIRISSAALVTSLSLGLALTLFVTATRLTTSANAIFLQSTAPLFLLLLGPRVLGEPLRRGDIGSALLMLSGLVVCLAGQGPASQTAPDPATGNLLGLAAGVGWAATLIGLRYTSRAGEDDGLSAVILGNAVAALMALPFALPFPEVSVSTWGNVIYLGVVQIGLAYVCLTRALHHVRAVEVSLLLLLEPVLNPWWTWIVYGEQPGRLVILGGAAIVLASALNALRPREARASIP